MDGMAVVNERTYLSFIPPSQVKTILTTYFSHTLSTLKDSEAWAHPEFIRLAQDDLKPEFEGYTKPKEKIRGLARTTGIHLMEHLSWEDIHDIIEKLSQKAVCVSGVRYPGRYVYVLACWAGGENPHAPENECYPVPNLKHTESALRAFIKELQELL